MPTIDNCNSEVEAISRVIAKNHNIDVRIAEKSRYLKALTAMTSCCFISLAVMVYYAELSQAPISLENQFSTAISFVLPVAVPLITLVVPLKHSSFRMQTEWGKSLSEINNLSRIHSKIKDDSDRPLSESERPKRGRKRKLQDEIDTMVDDLAKSIRICKNVLLPVRSAMKSSRSSKAPSSAGTSIVSKLKSLVGRFII